MLSTWIVEEQMIDNSAAFTKPIIGMHETNTMLITYVFLYIPWFKNSITLNLELVKVQSMVADWKCKRQILILFTLKCRYFSSKVTGQWFTLTDILHTEKRGLNKFFPSHYAPVTCLQFSHHHTSASSSWEDEILLVAVCEIRIKKKLHSLLLHFSS